jgi:hypothetical protein
MCRSVNSSRWHSNYSSLILPFHYKNEDSGLAKLLICRLCESFLAVKYCDLYFDGCNYKIATVKLSLFYLRIRFRLFKIRLTYS